MPEQPRTDAEFHALLHPKRRWPWVLLCVIAVLTAIVLTARLVSYGRVRGQLARIPADEPRTLRELDDWYPMPEGENAAPAWLNACAVITPEPVSDLKLLPIVGEATVALWEPMPPEVLKSSRSHVQANAEALRLMHKAAGIGSCRYPVDLTLGFNTPLSHLVQLRTASRLLSLDAMVAAESGDTRRAVRDIETQIALADSLKNEPLVISMFLRGTLIAVAGDTLERTLTRGSPTDEELERLQRQFSVLPDEAVLRRAFAGERAAGDAIFDASAAQLQGLMSTGARLNGLLIGAYKLSGLRDLDRYHYLRIMNSHVEAIGSLKGGTLPATPTIADELASLPKCCILTRFILPVLDHLPEEHALCNDIAHAAAAACAVERYRRETGRLPRALDDLVPTYLDRVPVDSFQSPGGPLTYRRIGQDGFMIYTIGRDLRDNGFPNDWSDGEDRGIKVRPPKPAPATDGGE